MMSLPKASWTSTVDSGVNVCGSPLRWDWKGHAFFGDLAQAGEAEDLEAAGIGEDGVGPGHEAVQSAELADEFVAGAQVEMIGVGEEDVDAEVVRRGRAG